jgi:hypothetical protein
MAGSGAAEVLGSAWLEISSFTTPTVEHQDAASGNAGGGCTGSGRSCGDAREHSAKDRARLSQDELLSRRRKRRSEVVTTSNMTSTVDSHKLNLRAGEWVEVRSADEILSTLDGKQSLDGLPFMPEMLQFCGRKFRVYKNAHKTCDTVKDYVIRRLENVVHLDGLRCDGNAHAGCQAGCLLFWKEAWLKRTTVEEHAHEQSQPAYDASHWACLLAGTRAESTDGDAVQLYRCQATDLLLFSTEVRRRDRWNPGLYLKDWSSGNITLVEFIRYGVLAMVNAFTDLWFDRRYPHVCGAATGQTPTAKLNLQAGDLVKVRSKDDIMQTVGPDMKNRGLLFDVEMVPFCENGIHRVLRKVERIVDEKTGRLIELPNPCVILDGVTCSGMLSSRRMFCPRSIYPYWREVWLRKAD